LSFLLTASIISFCIQNLLAFTKFKKLLNPISLFTIIHFMHNWSFSLSKYFSESLFWNVFPSVSYFTMNEVLKINLIGSWVFVFIILLFAKTKHFSFKYSITDTENLKKSYYILSFFYFIRQILIYNPYSAYGSDQALYAVNAFDPIQTLIFFRVMSIMIYIILNDINKKTIIPILLIELLISIFAFDRKDFKFIVTTIILKQLERSNFDIHKLRNYLLYFLLVSFLLVFVPQFRVANSGSNIENLIISLSNLSALGKDLLFYALNLANSEGVQNWTYQLVERGDLVLLNGKSYFQAIINMFILRPFQGDLANFQAAYYFKNVAYPDVSSTGFDYSFTAEAILNFGTNFAFISFAILGFFVAYTYSNRLKSDIIYSTYHSIWPVIIIGFRMDSTSFFRIYSYAIIIYLYIYSVKKLKKLN